MAEPGIVRSRTRESVLTLKNRPHGPMKFPPPPESDEDALVRFVSDNPELERLEKILGQFNLFEAMGVTRTEIRHSDFLAFLLNPRETHGLSDGFLKLFLKKACGGKPGCALSPVEVDAWNLSELEVEREWEGVDILLVHKPKEIVCWIENKIGTVEHSDQLARYVEKVSAMYPNFKKIPLYLTPDGSPPTHESYFPIDYALVIEALKSMEERLDEN